MGARRAARHSWQDTAGIIEAATTGGVNALVVGGVCRPGRPADGGGACRPFVVSLELRASSVTAVADVVLPEWPRMPKGRFFVNWEGPPAVPGGARDQPLSPTTACSTCSPASWGLPRDPHAGRGPRGDDLARALDRRAPRRAHRSRGRPAQRGRWRARPGDLAPPARRRQPPGRRAVPGRHGPRNAGPCPPTPLLPSGSPRASTSRSRRRRVYAPVVG